MTITQITRNATRAFDRQPDIRDTEIAMKRAGKLLTKYTVSLPDTAQGLRARQTIIRSAESYLARCRKNAMEAKQ